MCYIQIECVIGSWMWIVKRILHQDFGLNGVGYGSFESENLLKLTLGVQKNTSRGSIGFLEDGIGVPQGMEPGTWFHASRYNFFAKYVD